MLFKIIIYCRHSRNFYLNKRFFNMSAFIQKLNPLTGRNEWAIQEDDYDYHQEVAQSAFADMLHDTERNNLYEEALKVAIQDMHSRGKKANVLDIGTGTGLLSMMAVRHGADSVVACEAFKPMSQCALEVIKLNNCQDQIKVIPKRSTEIIVGEDMEKRANILVTEVFDTELIGEGALETFQHAHQNLLESDCIVVPHSGTIYAQVIESHLLTDWNRMKNYFNDEGKLELKAPESVKNCFGSANLHDIQISQLPLEFINQLIEPQAVFRFDFSGKTPFVFERSAINTIKAQRDGIAQGVFMWWDLNMDINNKLILSCAPYWAHPAKKGKNIPWRDHWMQAVYYFPRELQLKKDEEFSLISCHDEYSLWFNIKTNLKIADSDYERPICSCNMHNAYGRTRIGQMNDNKRNKKYLSLIENRVNKNSVVLVLSQGFYLALIAAKYAKKVYFLETGVVSRHLTVEFIEANKLDNVEIVNASKQVLDEKVNLVLAEPYYMTSLVPWHNLLLLHLLEQFKESLCDDVEIYPKEAIIKAVAMHFEHLHKIRAPLGICNGFLMKPFDSLIEQSCKISNDIVEAQPLWEYPGVAVSQVAEVGLIPLRAPMKESFSVESTSTFNIIDGYQCNGIAVWVDWVLDDEDGKKLIVSSGPTVPIESGKYIRWDMHTRQGVCLLGNQEMPAVFDYQFKYNSEADTCIEFKPVL